MRDFDFDKKDVQKFEKEIFDQLFKIRALSTVINLQWKNVVCPVWIEGKEVLEVENKKA